MKAFLKKSILVFLITLLSINLFSQNEDYHNRLYYLCKVWGFVKYHHTEIANGNVNWDLELINTIPMVKAAQSNDEFNEALQAMIDNAGEMQTSTVPMPDIPDELIINGDLSWMNNEIFSSSVSVRLDIINGRFRPQSNVYVQEPYYQSQPNFESDSLFYSGNEYPDEEVRILALFRYWNIISYFFPYKNLMDQDWDTTLVQFIPEIVTAQNKLEYSLSFKDFTTYINDSHGTFYSPSFDEWWGFDHPPFLVRFVEGETIIWKVLEGETTLKPGDIVRTLDGIDMVHIRDSLRKYAQGSNDMVVNREIDKLALWSNKINSEVVVENENGISTHSFTRKFSYYAELWQLDKRTWEIDTTENNCRVGIVNMGNLESEDIAPMFTDLWDTDAIIFDVRNYPKTIYQIAQFLFPDPIQIASYKTPYTTIPGKMFWKENQRIGSESVNVYDGNIAIIFNEVTQSHAEWTCMALEQFPNSIKIGNVSSGADGNVSKIYLPGKMYAIATFLGVFYPDHRPTQRIGIQPDFKLDPTIEGIRSGRDEFMEFALNQFNCTTGIEDSKQLVGFEAYPNPVKDYLNYKLPDGFKNEKYEIEIIDLEGRILKSLELNESENRINLTDLSRGVYVLKFVFESEMISKMIVKN